MINSCTLEGRTVSASAVKPVGGKWVETFRMVSSWNRKGQDGQWESKGLFFDVQRWLSSDTQQANVYKGMRLVVSGQLVNDEWTDKEGRKHDKLRLIANSIAKMAEDKPAQTQDADGQQAKPEGFNTAVMNNDLERFQDDNIPF